MSQLRLKLHYSIVKTYTFSHHHRSNQLIFYPLLSLEFQFIVKSWLIKCLYRKFHTYTNLCSVFVLLLLKFFSFTIRIELSVYVQFVIFFSFFFFFLFCCCCCWFCLFILGVRISVCICCLLCVCVWNNNKWGEFTISQE